MLLELRLIGGLARYGLDRRRPTLEAVGIRNGIFSGGSIRSRIGRQIAIIISLHRQNRIVIVCPSDPILVRAPVIGCSIGLISVHGLDRRGPIREGVTELIVAFLRRRGRIRRRRAIGLISKRIQQASVIVLENDRISIDSLLENDRVSRIPGDCGKIGPDCIGNVALTLPAGEIIAKLCIALLFRIGMLIDGDLAIRQGNGSSHLVTVFIRPSDLIFVDLSFIGCNIRDAARHLRHLIHVFI